MYIDAEKDGPKWASENDERITKVGRIIRKTRIDELPQLVNILKRDMSIIGPRPERPELIKEFIKYIPDFNDRLLVKPGITGLWQGSGRSKITDFDDVVKLDVAYIDNWTIWKDIEILLKTVKVVFMRDGAK